MRTIDLDKVRADTPGCAEVPHFNNAGAALPPTPVVDAVVEHLRLEASIGGYEAAACAEPSIARTYTAAAELIGADPDEIAILENATRAWTMAFYAVDFEPGDRILTSRAEYASNYIAYLHLARRTASVEPIPNDEHGPLDVQALRDALDERVKLIALTHVPIVTFTVDGLDPADVGSALTARRINVSVSGTGSTLLDMSDRGLAAVVRASVHYYNSEAEVDRFCAAISMLR